MTMITKGMLQNENEELRKENRQLRLKLDVIKECAAMAIDPTKPKKRKQWLRSTLQRICKIVDGDV